MSLSPLHLLTGLFNRCLASRRAIIGLCHILHAGIRSAPPPLPPTRKPEPSPLALKGAYTPPNMPYMPYMEVQLKVAPVPRVTHPLRMPVHRLSFSAAFKYFRTLADAFLITLKPSSPPHG